MLINHYFGIIFENTILAGGTNLVAHKFLNDS